MFRAQLLLLPGPTPSPAQTAHYSRLTMDPNDDREQAGMQWDCRCSIRPAFCRRDSRTVLSAKKQGRELHVYAYQPLPSHFITTEFLAP